MIEVTTQTMNRLSEPAVVTAKCEYVGCQKAPTHTAHSPVARNNGLKPSLICDDHAESVRKMEAYMRANGYPNHDYMVKPLGA